MSQSLSAMIYEGAMGGTGPAGPEWQIRLQEWKMHGRKWTIPGKRRIESFEKYMMSRRRLRLIFNVQETTAVCKQWRMLQSKWILSNTVQFYQRGSTASASASRLLLRSGCPSLWPSVRLSVRPSHSGVVSKQTKPTSWFLHRREPGDS